MDSPVLLPYRGRRPVLGRRVFVAPGARLIGDLRIGSFSSVWFNVVIRADVDKIRVGRRTNIQDNAVIHVAGSRPTLIGDDVTVGHSAVLHACEIGDLCLIGMGAVVLDEAVIGERSLVAAGALVPPGRRFPPGVLIKGLPATVARRLKASELDALRSSAVRYAKLADEYLRLRPSPVRGKAR